MPWQVRLLLVGLVIGTALGFIRVFIERMQDDPWLFFVTIAFIVLSPAAAYEFGRWRERMHAREQRERDFQLFQSVMAPGRASPATPIRQKGSGTRLIPVYNNGGQAMLEAGATDFQAMCESWIRMGYPTFTREYLRDVGADIGKNDNYRDLTNHLLQEGMIRRDHGKTDMDSPADPEHQLYRWSDPRGRDYTKGTLLAWCSGHDWDAFEDSLR